MTNGTDIIVKKDREFIIKLISEMWKDSVSEYPEKNEDFNNDELFIYKNQGIKDAWSKDGFNEKLKNTMIHCVFEQDENTLVIDDPEEEPIKELISKLKD